MTTTEPLPCSAERLMYYIQDALRDRYPGWRAVRHADRVSDDDARDRGGSITPTIYLVHPDAAESFVIDIAIGDHIAEAVGKEVLGNQ